VFLVSVFDSSIAERCAEPILPFTEGMRRHTPPGATQRQGDAEQTPRSTEQNGKPIIIDRSAFNQGVNAKFATHISEQRVTPSLVAKGPHAVAQDAIVFENSRRDGVRLYRDDVAHTLQAHMGTGGNNTPLAAIGIQGNVIGRQHHNGPAGKGHTEEGDPMFTLNTIDQHAVATELVVRRLTPIECERLMGWPDDWTAGQADSHRYKQCGNGVASPVARWIGEQLMRFA